MKTETKVILIGAIVTVLFLIGTVFLLSKGENVNVPEDQIVSRKGIHWHPRLAIVIKGEKQEIPANFGTGVAHLPIHTHDDAKDGVLHLEMQGLVTKEETRVGKFFQLWGKEFNSNRLFDKTSGSEGTVKISVNGQENKDFENYLMKDGDRIEIKYE